MDDARAAYDEVYVYSMGRPRFMLQHVVDAFAVQTATTESKRIGVVFGLVGLYLHVEKNFSGPQVQKVHMELSRNKREWPSIRLPADRGAMTVLNVLTAPEGTERDLAVHNCADPCGWPLQVIATSSSNFCVITIWSKASVRMARDSFRIHLSLPVIAPRVL